MFLSTLCQTRLTRQEHDHHNLPSFFKKSRYDSDFMNQTDVILQHHTRT